MRHCSVMLGLLGAVLVLCACGATDRPTAGGLADALSPEASLTLAALPELSLTPTPLLDAWGQTIAPAEATMYSEMRQSSVALSSTMEARRIESVATALASGPSSPRPRPTLDLRPTKVSPYQTPVSSGYILEYPNGGPYRYPILKNMWSGDLPDNQQVVVFAGGYHSLLPQDTTPAVGALLVEIKLPPLSPGSPPRRSKDDPRIGRVILPVRDGYARVVDARISPTEIVVFVRTEGGSTYTYEVNTHRLTQTGGPTPTPLAPGAPTPTVPIRKL